MRHHVVTPIIAGAHTVRSDTHHGSEPHMCNVYDSEAYNCDRLHAVLIHMAVPMAACPIIQHQNVPCPAPPYMVPQKVLIGHFSIPTATMPQANITIITVLHMTYISSAAGGSSAGIPLCCCSMATCTGRICSMAATLTCCSPRSSSLKAVLMWYYPRWPCLKGRWMEYLMNGITYQQSNSTIMQSTGNKTA